MSVRSIYHYTCDLLPASRGRAGFHCWVLLRFLPTGVGFTSCGCYLEAWCFPFCYSKLSLWQSSLKKHNANTIVLNWGRLREPHGRSGALGPATPFCEYVRCSGHPDVETEVLRAAIQNGRGRLSAGSLGCQSWSVGEGRTHTQGCIKSSGMLPGAPYTITSPQNPCCKLHLSYWESQCVKWMKSNCFATDLTICLSDWSIKFQEIHKWPMDCLQSHRD